MGSDKAAKALKSGDPQIWGHYVEHEAKHDDGNQTINGEIDDDRLGDKSERRMIDIEGADLSNLNLDKFRFTNVKFEGVDFSKTSFRDALFEFCILEHCLLPEADFSMATFTRGRIFHCHSNTTTSFRNCFFQGTWPKGTFEGANFRYAIMEDLRLSEISFLNADLSGASLRRSNLAGASWAYTKIDRHTNFQLAQFDGHPVTRDKSQYIRYPSWARKWFFNWHRVRATGNIPLFEFSWVVLLGALFFINTIKILNNARPKIFEGFNQIPVPEQLGLVIISSLLLALGSTIYKLFCPEQVREFSQAQWVYEHGHPRIEYLSQSLQRPFLQALTLFALALGAGTAGWIVFNRLIDAMHYLII